MALADVNRLLDKLAGLHIPAVPTDAMCGFDGTTYTLDIHNESNGACYTWWVQPPKEWKGLEEAAQQLIEMSQ